MKKFLGVAFAFGFLVSACSDSGDDAKSNAEQEESLVDEDADTSVGKENSGNEMSLKEGEGESSEEEKEEEDPEQEGSSDEDDQALADAITEEFVAEFEVDNNSIIQQDDADCVGEKYVKEIGVERLAEFDVTAEDASVVGLITLDDDEEEKVGDIFKDCVGVEKVFAFGVQQGGLEKDDAECIADKIDGGLLDRLIEVEEGDQEFFAALSEESKKAAETCGVEDALF